MDQPRVQDLSLKDWQVHPVVPDVQTKIFENKATHSLADVLIARVEVGGEIPWHVHESASETAYVLVGEGLLKYARHDKNNATDAVSVKAGFALTIPAGWWHTVLNTGDVPLELFAFHTPPTV